MRNVLLVLHILFAMFTIGPLTVAAFTAAAAARRGAAALPALRWNERVARGLGPATLVVVLTGIGLVLRSDAYEFGQTWIAAGLALYVVAAVNGSVLVGGAAKAAVAKLEAGASAAAEAGRITMLGVLSVAIDVTIVWLMVAKPGL